MKILSRKFTAIVLLAVMSISTFAIGVSTLIKPAVAESNAIVLPDTVQNINIEDIITGTDKAVSAGGFDFYHTMEASAQGTFNSSDLIFNATTGQEKLNKISSFATNTARKYGLYTTKATGEEVDGGNVYNVNEYDGNISFCAVGLSGGRVYTQQMYGFYPGQGNAGKTTVSLRMLYQKSYLYEFFTNTASTTNTNKYYRFIINDDKSIKINSPAGDVASYTEATLLAEIQKTHPEVTTICESGDSLVLTYGTFHTGTEKTNYYLKIVNDTKGFTIIETLVEGTYYLSESGYYSIRIHGVNNTFFKFNLCGVNEPIFAGDYDYEVADTLDASYVGQSVTALQLKNDYAHVADTQAVLTAGENLINVKYVADYYGKPMNKDAIVKVNVDAPVELNVAINDIDGYEIESETISGGEYVLPTFDRDKTFIAYVADDGKAYKQGETVAVTEDTTFTLVEAEFAVKDKIDLRLSKTDYYGGLRYTASVLTADYEMLTNVGLTVKTVIEPVTGSESGTAVAFKDAFVDDIYTCAYFTITELNYYNFNREFAGKIVIEVPYESGVDYVYSNEVIGSAYDLAKELVEANEQAIAGGQALYNGDAAEIINRYVYGVIDLNCVQTADGADVTLMANPWFSLENYSVVSFDGETLVLNVSVNVEDAGADYVNADNYSAPVILRSNSAEYKVGVVADRNFADGVLSFNVTVKVN